MFLLSLVSIFPIRVQGQDTSPEPEYDYSNDDFLFDDEEGITVIGTSETSRHMAVIDKETIEKHNAPDLASLLQETLNLGVTRYGGRGNMGGINLRGFDSKRVALLIDGVPVNSVMDGKVDIDQIDLNTVERIEVIYGGSDSQYNVSGALGGVINIITVKKHKPGLRLGASVSNTAAMPGEYRDRAGTTQPSHWEDLLDAQNYALSAAYGGNAAGDGAFSVTANVFANRAANHFIFKDYINKTRRKDNNEMWDTGADTSLAWEFPSLARVTASSNLYYSDKNIPTSGFSAVFGNQRDISTRHRLSLDAPRAFHDTLAAEASLVYSFAGREYIAPSGAESVHDLHNVMAINRWNWYQGQKLMVRSGFDYRLSYLDSNEIGSHNRHDGGVYLTAEFKPWNTFLVIPSVKAVITSGRGGGVTPVPKLGFLWNVHDSVSIKNNYFRSFKLPDFEDLYWDGGGFSGSPDLLPEDGWGTDFGTEWRFRELFKLENVFFTQWTKDSIHWAPGNGGDWRPENVGEAIFFGLDNKLRFEIPAALGPVQKIIPAVSWQYLLSYLLSYGYDFASDKRIPYMPEHTIGGSLEAVWETGSLLISAHYESLRYTNTANLTVLDPHLLLNVNLNQKIGSHFTAFASLRNILNTSYESFYDYPMPGITLTLGLKTRFELN